MAVSKVTVHFPCPVERVWHTVTDLTHTAWRSDLARVEVLDEGRFVEHTKSGYATNFAVTQSVSRSVNGPLPWRAATCPAPGKGPSSRRRAAPG